MDVPGAFSHSAVKKIFSWRCRGSPSILVEPLIKARGMMGASSLGRVALLGQDGRLADVASNRFDASTEPL
jgi:hypothetical protein